MVLLVGEKWVLLNPVSAQPQAEFAPRRPKQTTIPPMPYPSLSTIISKNHLGDNHL
jgi:hypothetical protein